MHAAIFQHTLVSSLLFREQLFNPFLRCSLLVSFLKTGLSKVKMGKRSPWIRGGHCPWLFTVTLALCPLLTSKNEKPWPGCPLAQAAEGPCLSKGAFFHDSHWTLLSTFLSKHSSLSCWSTALSLKDMDELTIYAPPVCQERPVDTTRGMCEHVQWQTNPCWILDSDITTSWANPTGAKFLREHIAGQGSVFHKIAVKQTTSVLVLVALNSHDTKLLWVRNLERQVQMAFLFSLMTISWPGKTWSWGCWPWEPLKPHSLLWLAV